MSKGEETRQTIVDEAMRIASTMGLGGISIGELAASLGLSKSGLFAHFGSKETLQIDVIHAAAERFVQKVVVPALRAPRGEPRVRALFEGWLRWGLSNELPGGCIFVSAAAELDDRPGPVRDALVKTQRDWLDALAQAARLAVEEGHFRKGLDVEQFAFEEYALMLGGHHHSRLLKDARSIKRTRAAFETLLSTVR
ncbi:MAG TPA: TetR/AcrR family transcriptional regulator [Myxococcota bacterium]|jgi:AcrR family transcriptional regulator|nr:TetR/AcrR family transcriptional regulator [Myxococcota bacterium]